MMHRLQVCSVQVLFVPTLWKCFNSGHEPTFREDLAPCMNSGPSCTGQSATLSTCRARIDIIGGHTASVRLVI